MGALADHGGALVVIDWGVSVVGLSKNTVLDIVKRNRAA
jgi:hypothetical protein